MTWDRAEVAYTYVKHKRLPLIAIEVLHRSVRVRSKSCLSTYEILFYSEYPCSTYSESKIVWIRHTVRIRALFDWLILGYSTIYISLMQVVTVSCKCFSLTLSSLRGISEVSLGSLAWSMPLLTSLQQPIRLSTRSGNWYIQCLKVIAIYCYIYSSGIFRWFLKFTERIRLIRCLLMQASHNSRNIFFTERNEVLRSQWYWTQLTWRRFFEISTG